MFSSMHVPRIVRSRSHTPQTMRGTSAHCIGAAIFPFVNGRCHLEQSLPFLKQSLPFITVVAISIHASSDKNVTSSRK